MNVVCQCKQTLQSRLGLKGTLCNFVSKSVFTIAIAKEKHKGIFHCWSPSLDWWHKLVLVFGTTRSTSIGSATADPCDLLCHCEKVLMKLWKDKLDCGIPVRKSWLRWKRVVKTPFTGDTGGAHSCVCSGCYIALLSFQSVHIFD